jgi:hypothetical protein
MFSRAVRRPAVPFPHVREIRPDVIQGEIAGLRRLGDVVRGLGQHD